jgi:hypothetical protein
LSDTLKLTVPDPLPLRPPVTVIHDAPELAVHVHPAWVVTVAVRLLGADIQGENWIGATEYSQASGAVSPDCSTVNVRLPTAMVPVRDRVSRFRSIEYSTVPLPEPGLPDVTSIQGTALVADHAQCAGPVTLNFPLSLPSSNDALAGEISTAQAPSPSCTTDTSRPATVSVPVRAVSDVFAVRLTFTTPVPVPFAPLTIDIQALFDAAVQVQPPAVLTVTEPAPPGAPTESEVVESVKVHGSGDGAAGELLSQPLRAAKAKKMSTMRPDDDAFRIAASAPAEQQQSSHSSRTRYLPRAASGRSRVGTFSARTG